MSSKAKAMRTLYRMGKVTEDGLREAVADGVITPEEFKEITGREY